MTLKVTNYSITGQAGKTAGVFVGAFKTSGSYAFTSLGFRGYDSSVGTDALSGYWTKSTGNAGNGSPKYEVMRQEKKHTRLQKNLSGLT